MDGKRHQGLRMRAAKLAGAANALKSKSGGGGEKAPFSLAFMTDRARVADPALVARALPEGAAVILRDYDTPNRAALAAQLAQICAARGVMLLVGADPDLARLVGAKGLHMPSWFLKRNEDAANSLSGMIVSAACHCERELRAAASLNADIALLSPAFPTASHPDADALGPARLRRLAATAPLPVLALGGVNETNAALLTGPNVAGLAAISAFVD